MEMFYFDKECQMCYTAMGEIVKIAFLCKLSTSVSV